MPNKYELHEIIADQSVKIKQQQKKIKENKKSFREIYEKIYSIGGPLNGNSLGFTREQFKIFYEIAKLVE